jgi:NAD(P)H-hydrate epimerase
MAVRDGHSIDALLSCAETALLDAAATRAGVPVLALMRRAGAAVADVVNDRFPGRPVLVLCGPGNNGGDGLVAATLLVTRGARVRVASLGAPRAGSVAETVVRDWQGDIEPAEAIAIEPGEVVIDALFGAGLTRPLAGPALSVVQRLAASGVPIIAVDVPSGLDGDTGAVRGAAARAAHTVVFCRKRPGHLLLPGRDLCGVVHVADIGMPAAAYEAISPRCWENTPRIWRDRLPVDRITDHKYERGHVLVVGGAAMTGAARLAARAAQRIGAGMVTIAAPRDALLVHRVGEPTALVEELRDGEGFLEQLRAKRRRVAVVGPGNEPDAATRARVLAMLASDLALVLDADALSAFAREPETLIRALRRDVVLTPHQGEFARVFGAARDKLSAARHAAMPSGTTIVLKGADTVIADPEGRAIINANAPPALATAGTGDVLAGMIAGLLARGMPSFEAAAAAVWLHGEAARHIGSGLIASDLPEALPRVLQRLADRESR